MVSRDERDELNRLSRETSAIFEMMERATGHVMPGMYYDKAGTPIGLGDWSVLFEDWEYRKVAITRVGTHRISTVWLGLSHAFFETMVSNESATQSDTFWDLQERYATEDQARAGHELIVDHVMTLVPGERVDE